MRNRGLRAHGFGQVLELPWPGGHLPDHGSAVPRTELDDRVRQVAEDSGAAMLLGATGNDYPLLFIVAGVFVLAGACFVLPIRSVR